MKKQTIDLNASPICLTCGIRDDHTTDNGYCQNGHDDWLELKDVKEQNEHFCRGVLLIGLAANALTERFLNSRIKQFRIRETYWLYEFEKLPTIMESHSMNLKIETKSVRVWLSRCTIADGEPYNNRVQIDRLVDGVWKKDYSYQAK